MHAAEIFTHALRSVQRWMIPAAVRRPSEAITDFCSWYFAMRLLCYEFH